MAASPWLWRKTGHDVRLNAANETGEVAEDLVHAPLLERCLRAEVKSEVQRAREILFGPVETVNGGEFLGAQNAQGFEELRADLVLAAIATRGGRQRRAKSHTAAEHHQQP